MKNLTKAGIISFTVLLFLLSYAYAGVTVGPRVYLEPSGANVSYSFDYNITFDSIEVKSTYIKINNAIISILPSSGSLNVTILNFTEIYKRWNESASNTTATVNHTIGNFTSNWNYFFKKNDAYWKTMTPNSTGYINFTYDENFSEIQFETEKTYIDGSSCSDNYQCHSGNCTGSFCVGDAPVVTLNSPADGYWTNNPAVVFNYTPVSFKTIVNCSLWGNFSGSWAFDSLNSTAIINSSANNFTKSLTNGSFLWNVKCEDNESGSSFAISNRTVGVDTIIPMVSATYTPLNPTTSTAVTVQSTASDILSGLNNIKIYIGGSLNATCLSSPCSTTAQTYAAGTYSYLSNATDNAGNYNTTSGNFTVTQAGGGPGGGGGGGGGGFVTTPTIASGEEVIYIFTDRPIYEVTFITLVDLFDPNISIEDLGSIKPNRTDVIPDGTVYKYVDLITSNIEEESTDSIRIKFKVPTSFYTEHDLDLRKTKLQRWTGSGWDVLNTSQIGSNDTYYYFRTLSDSLLSLFAITAELTGVSPPSTTCDKFCEEGEVLNIDSCECIPLVVTPGGIMLDYKTFTYIVTLISAFIIVLILRKAYRRYREERGKEEVIEEA